MDAINLTVALPELSSGFGVKAIAMTYKEVFELAQQKGYITSDRFLNDNGFRMPEWESAEVQLLELTLIQKWLRDEHKILVMVRPFNAGNSYFTSVLANDLDRDFTTSEEPSYEEALLQGINEALKLIP